MTSRRANFARKPGQRSVASRGRGFTIVELIVAAVVGALIAAATASALAQMFRARTQSRSHQQAFIRADTAAARVAMDLATVLRRSDPIQQKVSVVSGGSPGSEHDELLVLMNSQRPLRGVVGEPEGDEYEVQYRVMSGADGREALWRRMDIAHDEYVDAGGIATPIAGNVVALSVQATDETGEWFEEWDSDSDGLPHAVRVMVTAQSDDGRVTATAVRVVAIDRVPLPPAVDESETTDEDTGSASGSSGGARS